MRGVAIETVTQTNLNPSLLLTSSGSSMAVTVSWKNGAWIDLIWLERDVNHYSIVDVTQSSSLTQWIGINKEHFWAEVWQQDSGWQWKVFVLSCNVFLPWRCWENGSVQKQANRKSEQRAFPEGNNGVSASAVISCSELFKDESLYLLSSPEEHRGQVLCGGPADELYSAFLLSTWLRKLLISKQSISEIFWNVKRPQSLWRFYGQNNKSSTL